MFSETYRTRSQARSGSRSTRGHSPTPTRADGKEREREVEEAHITTPVGRQHASQTLPDTPSTARKEYFEESAVSEIREPPQEGSVRPFIPVTAVDKRSTSTPPPARSQPEPHRSPTSPHPTPARSKAKTRPPSIRSTKSITQQQYAQPHPLIRGSSFYSPGEYSHTVSPQTPGTLTGIKAPPIVTNSHTSGVPVPVESPTDLSSSGYFPSNAANRRRASQGSVASVATTLVAPTNKRASFALAYTDTNDTLDNAPTSTSKIFEANRDRKASTASTASLAALSLLAHSGASNVAHSNYGFHHQHHLSHSQLNHQHQASGARSNWHLPSFPTLGLSSTPPTRPSTPPLLSRKLPSKRTPAPHREGGSRYRNHLRRKHAHQFQFAEGDSDEEDSGTAEQLAVLLKLEDEEDEEGINEWIPQPYFNQHMTTLRNLSNASTYFAQSLKGSALRPADACLLRQSQKRVISVRNGVITGVASQ